MALWLVSSGVGRRSVTILHALGCYLLLLQRPGTATQGLCSPAPPHYPPSAPLSHPCPWTNGPPFPAQGKEVSILLDNSPLSPPCCPALSRVSHNFCPKAERSPPHTRVSNLILFSPNPLHLLQKNTFVVVVQRCKPVYIWGEEWK